MKDLMIHPVSNGFVVKAGCREFVFDSVDKLVAAFKEYQKNPVAYEKKMLENELNWPEIINSTSPTPPPAGAYAALNQQAQAMRAAYGGSYSIANVLKP